jgi:hypothetical protein
MAQSDLHRFYQPHCSHSIASLAAHQAKICQLDASLPSRAGKGYQVVAKSSTAPSSARRVAGGNRTIVVRSLVRAEPDVEQLASTLLAIVRDGRRDNS